MREQNPNRDKAGYEIAPSKQHFDFPQARPINTERVSFQREDLSRQIFVKSNFHQHKDGSHPVALWERHASHDNGEVFVSGPKPIKAALTKGVADALNELSITEISEQEFEAINQELLEKKRRIIEAKKAEFRKEYIALVGNDAGYEQAWKTREANDTLAAIFARI